MKFIALVVLAACLHSANAATFQAYALPQSHVSQRVLVEPGESQLPSKAVAYSAAAAAPVPAPQIIYTQLPTETHHTGTKVTVHYEPIETHGYIVRF
ncbi:hypothetical protein FHG87_002088 [Trinorchestia longiramus]|nr:hypothetical protein FHG87_002088 [Trinorchestia longiramus]